MTTPAISLKSVSKGFRIYPRHRHRLVEAATLGMVRRSHDFWALQDVNLEVERGSTLGVLGRNGAGKSTLLQVASGVLQPTHGTVDVHGQLVLLQLGAGFNPEFTGRENVMLNGLILGIDRRKMLDRFEEIEEFADLGDFMEQPVKTYSSGMRARLGFAVAVNVDPEILIVDETLSVGDAVFRHTGLQKMRELRDRGTTILFVTHSVGMVRNFCLEGALLHKGRLLFHGETSEALDRYQALISGEEARRSGIGTSAQREYTIDEDEDEEEPSEPSFKEDPGMEKRAAGLRHGTGDARVSSVELLDGSGAPVEIVTPERTVTVRVHAEYLADVEGSSLGITLRNRAGLDIFSTSTGLEKSKLGKRRSGERVIVDFTLEMPFQRGPYSVSAFISHAHNRRVYLDWVDVATAFKVERPQSRGNIPGLFHVPTKVEVHTPERLDDPQT